MVRPSLFIMTMLFALRLSAGYAARDSWIPIAGHGIGSSGRPFSTTVHLTDASQSMNDITISFYASSQPNVAPREIKLQLGPDQTGAVDVAQIVGDATGTGALHIQSTGDLISDARVASEGVAGTVVTAIPSQYAIGTNESVMMHVPSGARYRIYAVETTGFPLYFSVMTSPGSMERRLYLAPHEQRMWELGDLFASMPVSALRLSGVNGSGKIIAVGASVDSQTRTFAAWPMSLPTEPRHRFAWPELVAYIAIALALVAAAFLRRCAPQDRSTS